MAIIVYLYPQLEIIAIITTTSTLGIGIVIILFTLYTMLYPEKVIDANNPGKLSLSSLFTSNPKMHTNDADMMSTQQIEEEEQKYNIIVTSSKKPGAMGSISEDIKAGDDTMGFSMNEEL